MTVPSHAGLCDDLISIYGCHVGYSRKLLMPKLSNSTLTYVI